MFFILRFSHSGKRKRRLPPGANCGGWDHMISYESGKRHRNLGRSFGDLIESESRIINLAMLCLNRFDSWFVQISRRCASILSTSTSFSFHSLISDNFCLSSSQQWVHSLPPPPCPTDTDSLPTDHLPQTLRTIRTGRQDTSFVSAPTCHNVRKRTCRYIFLNAVSGNFSLTPALGWIHALWCFSIRLCCTAAIQVWFNCHWSSIGFGSGFLGFCLSMGAFGVSVQKSFGFYVST